jgi:hypothetical protein
MSTPPANWGVHQSQFRFDIRAEREECEWLFQHPARILQDRMVRRRRTNRTKQHACTDWEKAERSEVEARRLLHQHACLVGAKRSDITFCSWDQLNSVSGSPSRTHF